jgi:aspartate aminotransferase-like enzyme
LEGFVALTPPQPGHFFLPGPTEVSAEVLEAQVRPVLPHRGADMRVLMARLQVGLRPLFGTDRDVIVAPASATGMMEAAIRNGVRERVLCLVNGAFSERFAAIAEACGKQVERVDVPWGAVHDPDEVAERVASRRYDAVTLVHSETSTGALNPVADLALAVREANAETLVIVDSVTGVGGAPMHADSWALDFVLTGSQKALALPPGLALAVASEDMLARAAAIADRGFYFDLVRFARELERGETPTTPAVTLLYALERQLERIESETLEARWARHVAMARRCADWAETVARERLPGLEVLAPAGARSPTVTCLRLPLHLTGPDVTRAMRERGWVVGGGYGKLRETTIRIGHMGDHTLAQLDALLADLAEVVTP